MNKLSQYLVETGTTHAKLAGRLGVSRSHLTLIANGRSMPGRKLMVAIEAETGGAVPVLSWFDDAATDNGDAA